MCILFIYLSFLQRSIIMAMSSSIDLLTLASARVATQPIYYPANIGKKGPVSQKLTFVAYTNRRMSNGEERKTSYDIVAWGKRADSLAHTLHIGKELFLVLEPGTYEKHHFNQDRTPRLDAAGQHMVSKGTNYTIVKFAYGDDAAAQIDREIAAGTRPQFYNVKGHVDFETWRNHLKTQKDRRIPWDGRSAEFGCAQVRIPQGMVIDWSQYQGANVAGGGGQVNPNTNVNPAAGMNPNLDPRAGMTGAAAAGAGGAGGYTPEELLAVMNAMKAAGMLGQTGQANVTPPVTGGVGGARF
jgi:hypothetical protein